MNPPPCLWLEDNLFYGLSHHDNIIEWKNNTHHHYFILEFSKGLCISHLYILRNLFLKKSTSVYLHGIFLNKIA